MFDYDRPKAAVAALIVFVATAAVLLLQLSAQHARGVPRSFLSVPARPRIAILSMTTRETSYDHLSLSNKYKYAKKHGYDIIIDYDGPQGVWDKLTNIEKLVRQKKYDWIWWIDHDALITNPTIKVETVIEEALTLAAEKTDRDPADINIIKNADCNPLNAGSMIFRSTLWTIDFCIRLWACGAANNNGTGQFYSEQDCMRDLIADNEIYAGDKAATIPQWKMNAYPDEFDCFDEDQRSWEPGMFVLHFAGARFHVNGSDPVGDLMRKYSRFVTT